MDTDTASASSFRKDPSSSRYSRVTRDPSVMANSRQFVDFLLVSLRREVGGGVGEVGCHHRGNIKDLMTSIDT